MNIDDEDNSLLVMRYRNQQRHIKVAIMRRKKAYRECQLKEIKLITVNAMRRRIRRGYYMLAKPTFKKERFWDADNG